jgi:hypothetical protein
MRKRILWAVVVLVIATASFMGGNVHGKGTPAQNLQSRCAIVVPQDWGEYVGSGSYGVAFRDGNGTLRFVNQFPCGLEGAPQVALEIRRK